MGHEVDTLGRGQIMVWLFHLILDALGIPGEFIPGAS